MPTQEYLEEEMRAIQLVKYKHQKQKIDRFLLLFFLYLIISNAFALIFSIIMMTWTTASWARLLIFLGAFVSCHARKKIGVLPIALGYGIAAIAHDPAALCLLLPTIVLCWIAYRDLALDQQLQQEEGYPYFNERLPQAYTDDMERMERPLPAPNPPPPSKTVPMENGMESISMETLSAPDADITSN